MSETLPASLFLVNNQPAKLQTKVSPGLIQLLIQGRPILIIHTNPRPQVIVLKNRFVTVSSDRTVLVRIHAETKTDARKVAAILRGLLSSL